VASLKHTVLQRITQHYLESRDFNGIPLADLVQVGQSWKRALRALVREGKVSIVFRSPEETLEYARIHGIQRWMVYGDREGWWPIYTQAGPVNPPPPPKERVDISLH